MIATEFGTTELLTVAAIAVLLLILIFFAIAETSLNRISRVKAQAIAEERDTKAAHALYRLVSTPELFINPVLVTVFICQIGQAFLTSLLAARLFGTAGVIIGFLVNVIVFFLLSEAMPKTWAILHAERAALATARPTEAVVTFPPLAMLSRGLIGITNMLLPGKGLKRGPFVSEQELLGIVGAAAEDDVIEHEERQLIESIIEFGDTVAREIMVPRPDIVTVADDATVSEALDIAIENGFSRLPILGTSSQGEEDDMIGLAYTKDLIRSEREGGGSGLVTDLMRPVRFIPENKPVARLMREMQAEKFHLALVADEYGSVAGLVSLEDCLEELVGEIVDEFDDEVPAVQIVGEGEYVIDGGLGVSDLNELLGLRLPDDDWDTLGGFVFGTLEHVPAEGEVIVFEGWRFVVDQVEGRRVRQVRAFAPTAPASGESESDPADVGSRAE